MPDPDAIGSPPAANDLDRNVILAAMATVKRKVMECGDQLSVGGTLRAKVTVASSGKVTNVVATGIDDAALQACVVKVIKTVKLAKTDNGGAFSFPFSFQATDLSDTLDAEVMEKGLAKLEKKISACHNAGTITMIRPQALKIDVDPSGKVTKVWTYGVSGDVKTDNCVERVFKAARFGKSKDGGAFTYPRIPAEQPGAGASMTPGSLAPSAITAGIETIKATIVACGGTSKVGGTVTAHVTVGTDGKVTSATADGSTDAALNTCVANTIKNATFASSRSGSVFSYPFVFGAPSPPPTAPTTTGSDALDRAMISDGIKKVKAAITACGDGKTKGVVKISVVVAPAGTVTSAKVTQTPADALGTCVSGVISKATFAKTGQGGSFSYPFVF